VGQSGGNKNKNKWDPKEGLSRNKGYQLAGCHLITQQLGNPVSMNPMPTLSGRNKLAKQTTRSVILAFASQAKAA
jgi:hypothetical protein